MRSGTSFPRSQRNKGIGTAVKANLVSASIKKCHPPASAHWPDAPASLSSVVSTSSAPLHAYRGACTTTRGINSSRWKILLSLQTQNKKKRKFACKVHHAFCTGYVPAATVPRSNPIVLPPNYDTVKLYKWFRDFWSLGEHAGFKNNLRFYIILDGFRL